MRLRGISVVCEPDECPLCRGLGFLPVGDTNDANGGPPVLCSHALPNTAEFTEQMRWALHLATKPRTQH